MLAATQVSAQNNITSSPYSLFGIGDPLEFNNTMGLSMGDVKYATSRPFYLNSANPASYSSLKATTFSLGAMVNRTRTFNQSSSQDNDNGTLRYFGIGIPINKKIGMSLGSKPFTSFGYGIQQDEVSDTHSGAYTRYQGEGGMSIAYAGLGYEIYSDSVHRLSLGANANYYFGNKEQSTINNLETVPGALSSAFVNSYITGDFAFDLGMLYSLDLQNLTGGDGPIESTLTFGGTYALANHLKTKFESFAGSYYYNTQRDFVYSDTLSYAKDTSSIYLPTRYGLGVNYQLYNRTTKDLLILEANYEYFGWSDLKLNGVSSGLSNSTQVSFGMQFVPDASKSRGFFEILRYRIGGKYKTTRINLGGTPVDDYSVSMGVGIPLVKSKSIYPSSSTIDIGVAVGNRGTENNGLIREQYTNIYVGLSFSPNFWDKWFEKRKIN